MAYTQPWTELLTRTEAAGFDQDTVEHFLGKSITEAGPNEFDRLKAAIENVESGKTEILEDPKPPKKRLPKPPPTPTLNIGDVQVAISQLADPVMQEVTRQQGVKPPHLKDFDSGRGQRKLLEVPGWAKALEEKKRFHFVYLTMGKSERARDQFMQLSAVYNGIYLIVTRSQFERYVVDADLDPEEVFDPTTQTIRHGDAVLAYASYEIWQRTEQKDREGYEKRLERAVRGVDSEGKIGGANLVMNPTRDTNVEFKDQFIFPGQPGITNDKGEFICPLVESE